MAMTGFFYTFKRPRTSLPMGMLKYDPIGMHSFRSPDMTCSPFAYLLLTNVLDPSSQKGPLPRNEKDGQKIEESKQLHNRITTAVKALSAHCIITRSIYGVWELGYCRAMRACIISRHYILDKNKKKKAKIHQYFVKMPTSVFARFKKSNLKQAAA